MHESCSTLMMYSFFCLKVFITTQVKKETNGVIRSVEKDTEMNKDEERHHVPGTMNESMNEE